MKGWGKGRSGLPKHKRRKRTPPEGLTQARKRRKRPGGG